MNASRLTAVVFGFTLAAGVLALAQDMPDHTSRTAFFVVEATARKVQPPGTSSATGTGAFMVDAEKRTLTYEFTYHGLENGPAQSVALHNFGAGGNGARIQLICGQGAQACPSTPSATLSGTIDGSQPGTALQPGQLVEYATGRIYLEIVGGNGRPEIRGQLEPNNSMVHPRSFVATLKPSQGTGTGTGTGTAVLSEVRFPDGRTNVFYRVTVAGTSGAPQGVALTGVPNAQAESVAPAFSPRSALPQGRAVPSRSAATGGTFSGQYDVRPDNATTPLATRMLSERDRSVAITVRTSRFPAGELVGIFREVQ